MTILDLFINFANKILDLKILNISLYTYLISFTILIFIFKLIGILGNTNGGRKKSSSDDYEPRHAKK